MCTELALANTRCCHAPGAQSLLLAFICCLCKVWDVLFLFSGLRNASWLMASRIPRKAAAGVRVRVSQSAPHSAAGGLAGEREMLNQREEC